MVYPKTLSAKGKRIMRNEDTPGPALSFGEEEDTPRSPLKPLRASRESPSPYLPSPEVKDPTLRPEAPKDHVLKPHGALAGYEGRSTLGEEKRDAYASLNEKFITRESRLTDSLKQTAQFPGLGGG